MDFSHLYDIERYEDLGITPADFDTLSRFYDTTQKVFSAVDLGLPFTLYMGGDDGHLLDPKHPHVFLTFAEVDPYQLPGPCDGYSFLDFGYSPSELLIHSPQIKLLSEHQGVGRGLKMQRAMESVGKELGCRSFRVYTVINDRLLASLPRLGYTRRGRDDRGRYLEKLLRTEAHNL